MNFKAATDILGLPATRLAEAFNLQPQTIRQMRLAPDADSYRTPPTGWERIISGLAREREEELRLLRQTLASR
jgi:hypothetical protein